jgi:hypothetical protein
MVEIASSQMIHVGPFWRAVMALTHSSDSLDLLQHAFRNLQADRGPDIQLIGVNPGVK